MIFHQPFRFEMGLRRGDEAFFRNRDTSGNLLAERQQWLREDEARYAARLPAGEALFAEASQFFGRLHQSSAPPTLGELGTAWEPDFLLLQPTRPEPILVAGCVCFPSTWDLGQKIGQPMSHIHAPVPTLNESLGQKIEMFFERLQPGAVWERWNWGLAATPARNLHPALPWPRLSTEHGWADVWLRAEHQAFLRLPQTQGILFAIRLEITPLADAIADATAAKAFANALATTPPAVAHYKGMAAAIPRLIQEAQARS